MDPSVDSFVRFVIERHRIWQRREKSEPKPWTKDPILQSYRFCNVYRELDTTTQWIRKNWSTAYGKHPDLWFAMVVSRLVNSPLSLMFLEPLPWNPYRFVDTMEERAGNGNKVFGSAYIVSTNGRAMPKAQYLAAQVLTPLWEAREKVRPRRKESLGVWHSCLSEHQGMGSFISGQVVADVKNTHGSALAASPDWWSWCAPGPGSIRGLNRILGNGPARTQNFPGGFMKCVNSLRLEVNTTRMFLDKKLCAQDIQNCLCEFDKYERVRLGEGAPKQRYPGV